MNSLWERTFPLSRGNFVHGIGARLLEERERLGLNQTALAERCGITMRSQRNYEKEERFPDASYLAAFAALGADILYILTGQRTGESVPSSRLKPDEAAPLDNYRHSPPEGQKAIRTTCAALAQPRARKRSA